MKEDEKVQQTYYDVVHCPETVTPEAIRKLIRHFQGELKGSYRKMAREAKREKKPTPGGAK